MSHKLVTELANGCMMPRMGLGTLLLKDKKSIEHAIAKVGYRHIDTAQITMNEKEVGQAIKASGVPRDQMFVTTKLWHTYYHDPETALKKSLAALDTDYVDMYVIHWPNNHWVKPQLPMHTLWSRMESLIDLGLTRGIGLSNFNTQLTCDMLTYARHAPVYNQVQLNPYNAQADAVKFMQAHDIEPVAASPLGRLRSKLGPKGKQFLTDEPIVQEIAQKYGKTPAQIILAWGLARGYTVIPKATSPEFQQENWDAGEIELEKKEIRKITGLNKNEVLFKSAPDVKFNMLS